MSWRHFVLQYSAMLNQGLLEGMIGFFDSLTRPALENI